MPLKEFAPRTPMPNYRDYEIKVKPLEVTNPAKPREYYWSLYYKGLRVNGGISASQESARERASRYQFDHHRQVWLRQHIWDEESLRWEYHGNIVM